MPAPMTHLLAAHAVMPQAPGPFWAGSIMPDHVNERTRKDHIHLRDAANRWHALFALRAALGGADDPFARGWLLHLFVDLCWEEGPLQAYIAQGPADWFVPYRQETKFASIWLYGQLAWMPTVCEQMLCEPVTTLHPALDVTQADIDWYCPRVIQRHRTQTADGAPSDFFTLPYLTRFAVETAARYRAWLTVD